MWPNTFLQMELAALKRPASVPGCAAAHAGLGDHDFALATGDTETDRAVPEVDAAGEIASHGGASAAAPAAVNWIVCVDG